MVKIRLTRTGKKHQPHYRIVATDSRKPRDGKYIEQIGYYNPRTKPPTLEYDREILQKWLDNGAQMTDTVYDMFVREKIVKQSPKRKKRIELISAPKAAEEEEKEDTPAEEKTPPTKDSETTGTDAAEKSADKEEKKTAAEEKEGNDDDSKKKAPEKKDPKKDEDKDTKTD